MRKGLIFTLRNWLSSETNMKRIKKVLGKINFKKLKSLGYWLVIVLLALIAGITALSALNIPSGIKLYNVQSGSMSPKVPAGSIVVVKSADLYKPGEVITFKAQKDRAVKNPKFTTTHRIMKRQEDNTGIKFITKGDANDDPDSEPVDQNLVLGKVILTIPILGYPVAFAKTQAGLIILIIIPATIIIFSELVNIKKEVKRLLSQRKTRKKSKKQNS